MHILIDGYNLLNHLFPGYKGMLDKPKALFLRQLAAYHKTKKTQGTQITVVFDGGASTHATRVVKDGIALLYSGSRMSADDWIIEHVSRSRSNQALVITLDRALREAVERLGADWLSVQDFYTLVQHALAGQPNTLQHSSDADLVIYDRDDLGENTDASTQALDALMEQACAIIRPKPEDATPPKRNSKGYTPSKVEKAIAKKLKKLS